MRAVPAILLSDKDNVLTLLAPGSEGDCACTPDGGMRVLLLDEIPLYHKAAGSPIPKGGPVIKYGVVIGAATEDILSGRWVHLHNMRSLVDEKSSDLDLHTGTDPSRQYA
jgi:hypothetical protein